MMGIVVIFSLVSLLALFGLYRALRRRNILGCLFALGTAAVFGWFSIMTFINNGFPPMH